MRSKIDALALGGSWMMYNNYDNKKEYVSENYLLKYVVIIPRRF